jgi:hypothetical protein
LRWLRGIARRKYPELTPAGVVVWKMGRRFKDEHFNRPPLQMWIHEALEKTWKDEADQIATNSRWQRHWRFLKLIPELTPNNFQDAASWVVANASPSAVRPRLYLAQLKFYDSLLERCREMQVCLQEFRYAPPIGREGLAYNGAKLTV